MKHFISLFDCTKDELLALLALADRLKKERKTGVPHPLLAGKTLGMIFTKSSTRTRVSFEVGMYQRGRHALILASADIQLGRGETVADTARTLSRYLEAIMIRTFKHQDVLDLARFGSIPVINGLTDLQHPCQVLADLQTVAERKGRLEGLKLAYLGDGNNMANSLLHGCAKVGMDIAVAAPAGYACDPGCVEEARFDAAKNGSSVLLTTDPDEAVAGADVVYTDTWVSMGQEQEKAQRLAVFEPYRVDARRMAKAKPDAVFLHCLPAYRGYEVTEDVIDGPQSAVFDEAENRLHAQKAVLATLLAGIRA
jgi:ornithine carbamoyltransferase